MAEVGSVDDLAVTLLDWCVDISSSLIMMLLCVLENNEVMIEKVHRQVA